VKRSCAAAKARCGMLQQDVMRAPENVEGRVNLSTAAALLIPANRHRNVSGEAESPVSGAQMKVNALTPSVCRRLLTQR